MKSLYLCAALAAIPLAAGCGDNSKVCGPGTDDLDGDGFCEPGAPPAMCSNGTILDPDTNACVIDPASCQNGTVLINNRCVDPTEGLVVDLSEGPEPNNAGVGGIEESGALAGEIRLKAQGEAFVVKGTISPFRDADDSGEPDPDMDAYRVSVDAPVLLDVSVDGVNGLMGAYLVVPLGDNPAAGWRRFGINITGDTSRRQLYLPAAGTYVISVADTRSLFLDAGSPPAAGEGGAAGHPEATYFMSITVLPAPAPTALTASGGVATSTGTIAPGDVKLFSVPMGVGLNEVEVDIPTTPRAAVVVTRNDAYKADGAEVFDIFQGPLPARVVTGGFLPEDGAVVAVDTVYHYGPGAVPYTLTVRQGDAVALSRTGGTASHPEVPGRPAVFYYDVAAADEVTGFALTWNQPVGGVIVDDNVVPVASFTLDPDAGAFTDRTFTEYTGLIRHRRPGRYYFLVFDPDSTGPTEIAATSSIAAQPVAAVVKGTPLADQPVSAALRARAFTYDAGTTDRWQRFDVRGTGTGAIAAAFYDRAGAYGRLGPLAAAGSDPLVEDAAPLFTLTFPETGGARGRVLLDDPATSFLVTATAAAPTGAPAVTLDFQTRGHHDFMTIGAGQTAALADQQLDATTPVRFYLLRALPGRKITVTVHPDDPALDTRIQVLARDEAVLRTASSGGAGADDVTDLLQTTAGWTALAVSSVAPPAGAATFDLSIGVTDFTPPMYAATAGTTLYVDACLGGTVQPLVSDGAGPAPANDEGFTAQPIAAPAGFSFFGLLEPQLTVSTNGWLSFGQVTRAGFLNGDLPSNSPPDALVAPYWDDLANVVVCTRAAGDKLVVQWTGNLFASATAVVQLQAILDGASDTIELVWGPGHVPDGASATVGIEDQAGVTAHRIGFNTPGVAQAGTAVVLAPM